MSQAVQIEVTLERADWTGALPGARTLARRAAAAALAEIPLPPNRPVELGLLLSDDAHMRILNRDWRGQDRPTNVLSFAAGDTTLDVQAAGEVSGGAMPLLLGDVVLALETVQREASGQGKSLADHVAHLVVHGVLHLGGHDHEDPREAEDMERLERAILAGLGIADPYADPPAPPPSPASRRRHSIDGT